LSPDFQLFILAPLLVYPLWRFGRKILITLPLLASASVFFIFISSYEFGFTLEMNELVLPLNQDNCFDVFHLSFRFPSTSKLYNNIIYQSFYSRLFPYLSGMLSAYVLRNKSLISRIPSQIKTSLWFLSIGTLFGLVIGTFFFQSGDHSPSNLSQSMIMAASQVGWSLAIVWMILACEASGGFVNS
jgi:hypothetical protein